MTSSLAPTPSFVCLPSRFDEPITVLEFLIQRFSHIGATVWEGRLKEGKVLWETGHCVKLTDFCCPNARVYYYREVLDEPKIPDQEEILWEDEHAVIVFKPHFIPTTPSGSFVNECLLNRLKRRMGIMELAPVHRLDRDTSGLVVFTKTKKTRAKYHALFAERKIIKSYYALAKIDSVKIAQQLTQGQIMWEIKNRMIKDVPTFLMKVVAGEVNAYSKIRFLHQKDDVGVFELQPVTGKTHQLRLHMLEIGAPILNDRFYPELMEKKEDDFSRPLKLMAHRIRYQDPFSYKEIDVCCCQERMASFFGDVGIEE